MDQLTFLFSMLLEIEEQFKKAPTLENEKRYGKTRWELHCAIKQNLEVMNYYANGGSDGGLMARNLMSGAYVPKQICKNCK